MKRFSRKFSLYLNPLSFCICVTFFQFIKFFFFSILLHDFVFLNQKEKEIRIWFTIYWFLYSWIHLTCMVWGYVRDTWDIFTATSIFPHNRLMDQIFGHLLLTISPYSLSLFFHCWLSYHSSTHFLDRLFKNTLGPLPEFFMFQLDVTSSQKLFS